MKIYIASSYKSLEPVRILGVALREIGYDVYVFCDEKEDAYKHSMTIRASSLYRSWTPKTAMMNKYVQMIYESDIRELDSSDILILVLPSGKSAHLEAGYAKGKGKKVFLYGDMELGSYDAMYGMIDKIYDPDDTAVMLMDFHDLLQVEKNKKLQTIDKGDIANVSLAGEE